MEYTHTQKNVRHSPRKLRLVADMIRRMSPEQAIEILQFVNKAAALDLIKALTTALANVGKKNLTFKRLEINEGVRMKRFRAGSKGLARPYKRRLSHIKIVLTDEIQVKSQKEKVKSTNQNSKIEKQDASKEEKGAKQR